MGPLSIKLEGVFSFKLKVFLIFLMGRILAIDYGMKRIGLAVTDPTRITSGILPFQQQSKFKQWLASYFEKEEVDIIVIGYPVHRDGKATNLTIDIDLLINYIKKIRNQIKIVKLEESFSTKEAMDLMINKGLSKKKRREEGLLDSYSALIILEDHLRNKK